MNPFDVNAFAPMVAAIKALPWLAAGVLCLLALISHREARRDRAMFKTWEKETPAPPKPKAKAAAWH